METPDYLKLPVVEPRKYALDEAAKLIAGRYGNAADVLDFITEQAGEGLRDIDAERVRDLAAPYRSPARMETVTGCEALHWIAFGFLVGQDEAQAREDHLGKRWCHGPLGTARPLLEAAAEDPPRYLAPRGEEVIQLMIRRVALDGEHATDPRALLALYNRDMAVREWCRERLRAASRRLIHAPKREQFVVWGSPSDGSGRREIPMKFLTAPGMIFWTTSEFRPDGEADINVYAQRRKDPVWREIVLPAKAIYEIRNPNRGGAVPDALPATPDASSFPTRKRPSDAVLDEWMKKNVQPGDKRDSTIAACREATGATVRKAIAAWDRLPPEKKRRRGERDITGT